VTEVVKSAGSVDGLLVTERLRSRVVLVVDAAASITCPRTALAGPVVVARDVGGSPETVDTALPTAAFEAVIVVEAVCWTVPNDPLGGAACRSP
jgi:hypothetical protein